MNKGHLHERTIVELVRVDVPAALVDHSARGQADWSTRGRCWRIRAANWIGTEWAETESKEVTK